MKPAEVNLGPVKRVAVMAIQGAGGEDVSDQLTQAILATGRYEVVDRQHLAQIVGEQEIGAQDETIAAKVGKVLGAAALIFGRVSNNKYDEGITFSTGTCRENKQDLPCTTYVRTGTHKVALSLKVVSSADAKYLASRSLQASKQASTKLTVLGPNTIDRRKLAEIHASIPSIDNVDDLKTQAIGDTVAVFMKAIAPYQVMVRVILYDEGKLPPTSQGVVAAKRGDWTMAVTSFQQAVALANDNKDMDDQTRARAIYNLGVALGYGGDYAHGIAEINRAYEVYAEETFLNEVTSLKQFMADDAKLKKQAEDAATVAPATN